MFGEVRWESDFDQVSKYHGWYILFGFLNFVFTIAQAYILHKEYLGSCTYSLAMFLTQWRFLDVLYISLNLLLSFCQTFNLALEFQRRLAAFVTLIIFARFLYFLRLMKVVGEYVEGLFDCF